ncbi:ABC transporter ATP-binding protein, partial [Arthrospira sp. PCC 8006]|uniref:ATP-binding cassette domain-containing protein n=1 Tax=Arthrospira sp. PCC 8006 TaxID=1982224 RepID=UPI00396E9A47
LMGALGLDGLSDRFPEQLSGGEQQRVGVARAVAHRPGLVLADEPTGSLDLDNAVAVIDLLSRACRERGSTLLMVTHSQDVMDRADRLLRLA